MVSLFLKKRNGTYILDKKEFRSRLKSILGFSPGNLMIYEMAFIHRSASFLLPDGTRINNERLEYLGDAVLNSILSEHLFSLLPDADEGTLTKTRSKLVNREILNQTARKMGIDTLLVTQTATTGNSRHLYGNALEALTGAIFIDRGYKKTRKLITVKLLRSYIDLRKVLGKENDYNSLLFECAQRNRIDILFNFREEFDEGSKRVFFCATLTVGNKIMGEGQGSSKKEAEQEASRQAWYFIAENQVVDRQALS